MSTVQKSGEGETASSDKNNYVKKWLLDHLGKPARKNQKRPNQWDYFDFIAPTENLHRKKYKNYTLVVNVDTGQFTSYRGSVSGSFRELKEHWYFSQMDVEIGKRRNENSLDLDAGSQASASIHTEDFCECSTVHCYRA